MAVHILGYGPITDRLSETLSESFKTIVYSENEQILITEKARPYTDFLGLDVTPKDIFILAWRSLPKDNDEKFLVLNFLKKNLTNENLFIYLSSVAIYGESDSICSEDSEAKPINSYGESKLELERHLEMHLCANRFFFRISNVFGDVHFDDFVNRAAKSAIFEIPIEVNDPSEIFRDFISIENVVKCLEAVVSSPNRFSSRRIFNISSGKSTSLSELICMIERATGKNLEIIVSKPNEEIIKRSFISNSSIFRILGTEQLDNFELLQKYLLTFNSI